MIANVFAIFRRFVGGGVDKRTADAVAEEVVTHSDEHLATKSDVARLEGNNYFADNNGKAEPGHDGWLVYRSCGVYCDRLV